MGGRRPLPPQVKAMIPQVTESALTLEFLRQDGCRWSTPFVWGVTVAGPGTSRGVLQRLVPERKTSRALTTLPLDRGGHRRPRPPHDYVQDILAQDAESPRWAGIDHRTGWPG